MGFKDHVASDNHTFINSDEYADQIVIDGVKHRVVIDDDRLQKRAADYGGIATGMILYFIPVDSLSKKPSIGDSQNFNGRLMFIEDVKQDFGVYEILLNQHRSE